MWNYHILVYYFKIYSYSWSVFKSKNIPEGFAEQLFSLWFQYTFRDKNKLHFTKRCAFYHCQLEVNVYKHTTSCGWQQVFISLVCTFTAEMKWAKEALQPLDTKTPALTFLLLLKNLFWNKWWILGFWDRVRS